MSEHGLAAAVAKMRAAGANEPAIDVFAHYYAEAAAGVTGMIPESTISPLTDPPQLSDAAVDPDAARAAIARTVIIKLNGGLGTSLGLDQAKTLLPVREGRVPVPTGVGIGGVPDLHALRRYRTWPL